MSGAEPPPAASRTIAVVGASRYRRKFGNKAVRAYRQAGWTVYPVNPHADEVEGLPCVATLAELAHPVERISVYLHPSDTRALLPAMAACGAREVWLNPGSADAATLSAAEALGLPVRPGCSIVDVGMTPEQFP